MIALICEMYQIACIQKLEKQEKISVFHHFNILLWYFAPRFGIIIGGMAE